MFFTDLKRTFRTGSGRTGSGSGAQVQSTEPSSNEVSLDPQAHFKLSRHDPHNLELKSTFKLEGESLKGQFQLFLFLPSSVHLSSYSKSELKDDFHTLARLAIPKSVLNSESAIPREIQYFRSILNAYREPLKSANSSSVSIVMADHVFESTRRLGAILGEALRSQGNLVKKELLLACSLINKATDISANIELARSIIVKITAQVDELHSMTSSPELQDIPVIRLLNQYINQIYIEFLGSIWGLLEEIPEDRRPETFELKSIIKGLREDFSPAGSKRIDPALLTSGDQEREKYLLLRSQLKKFFQSEMFIDVEKQEVIKKYSEPAAVVGALIACLGALGLEQIGLTSWSHAGIKGASVICLGILAYVLKDRLKDRFRNYFTHKIGQVVPDHERILTAEGKRFATVQEWFHVKKSATVPKMIQELRLQCCLSEAEKHIPEDVLQYKREFEIRTELASQFKGEQRSLHEIVRINLQRYLKHMDDAYKGLFLLDSEGNFSNLKSHRVYHFYACLIASQANGSAESLKDLLFSKMYRIVMDKNGIVRVEAV